MMGEVINGDFANTLTRETMTNSRTAYIVFGATGGIGVELVNILHAAEANIMLAARDEEKLVRLSKEIDGNYSVIDARNFDEVEKCVNQTVEKFGRIDGVVNCVGSLLLKPAHLTKEEEFDYVIATNLKSAFACVRSSAKVMRENGGSIVLVSSAAAQIGLSNHEAIAAAKAGIIGLTKSAAATYARNKIRVNCVAPGLVETPLTKKITDNELNRSSSLSMHPLGRLGKPTDIAAAIAWLLSSQSDWVTGQVLTVDGGLSGLKVSSSVAQPR
jgi:NAD(P)-dependent dehydrogenase (short-subunit alcohol dehydrogenase family)